MAAPALAVPGFGCFWLWLFLALAVSGFGCFWLWLFLALAVPALAVSGFGCFWLWLFLPWLSLALAVSGFGCFWLWLSLALAVPGFGCCASGGAVIAPCWCKGTQKYVHSECLDQWRAAKVSHCRKEGRSTTR